MSTRCLHPSPHIARHMSHPTRASTRARAARCTCVRRKRWCNGVPTQTSHGHEEVEYIVHRTHALEMCPTADVSIVSDDLEVAVTNGEDDECVKRHLLWHWQIPVLNARPWARIRTAIDPDNSFTLFIHTTPYTCLVKLYLAPLESGTNHDGLLASGSTMSQRWSRDTACSIKRGFRSPRGRTYSPIVSSWALPTPPTPMTHSCRD